MELLLPSSLADPSTAFTFRFLAFGISGPTWRSSSSSSPIGGNILFSFASTPALDAFIRTHRIWEVKNQRGNLNYRELGYCNNGCPSFKSVCYCMRLAQVLSIEATLSWQKIEGRASSQELMLVLFYLP